ncbi:MAG: hypothetical protein ACTSSP_03355 [Candidatus Asgardarchaeia archaeon]
MDNKVSDFKIAESIIRKFCKRYNASFSDVFVSFDEDVAGALFIDDTKNIAHTIFKIVAKYIEKSIEIVGVEFMPDISERNDFLIMLATNLRSFIYKRSPDRATEEPYILRLYQYSLVWILMKDIICPIYDKDLVNLKMICAGSPHVDIAKYYKKEEIPTPEIAEEDFIFVNRIDNRVVQTSFIFMEALRAYGLSPIEVVKNIYETDLYDKFRGLLEIGLDSDDEINDFECTVMTILGINCYGLMTKKMTKLNPRFVKTAQNSVPGLPNQFWYLGILEKMIEPARGGDWSVYQNLQPYVEQFWAKVEEVKQKRMKSGHDEGVPFDELLRIKSKQTVGYETDPTQTIQSLLSSDRVW